MVVVYILCDGGIEEDGVFSWFYILLTVVFVGL